MQDRFEIPVRRLGLEDAEALAERKAAEPEDAALVTTPRG